MLAPETRALLTDSLRPPDGWRVDIAVGTSFSLDLAALLLAPMSFALHETEGSDLDVIDQIALLEALRRYAGRTTLFVQAGGIHPPAKFSVLMQLLEGSVCQVAAPTAGRIFHPKVWVLRFRDVHDDLHHRVLVLSRNLTFDRSWDTLLQLDEADSDARAGQDVTPIVTFVRALPGLAVGELERDRADQIADLATTLGRARFELPPDFTGLRFLPFGLGATDWSFPAARRALLISPFLDAGSSQRWVSSQKHAIVLSRPESFDRVGPSFVDDSHQAWTLTRPAEVEVGDDPAPAQRVSCEWATVRDGLHAKTFVFENGRDTTVVTGSANLTTAAFGGNVEFSVALDGPTARCGIDTLWLGSKESPGLSKLAAPYTPQAWEDEEQARAALEMQIDDYHRLLASRPPTAHLTAVGSDTVDVTLTLDANGPPSPGDTFMRPASLPPIRAAHLAAEMRWLGQARRNVTPFFTVDTTIDRDGLQVRRHCVIVVGLAGDVGDRRSQTMGEILRNAHDVLRYLSLLLTDPRIDPTAGLGVVGADGSTFEARAGYSDLVVLEPLIRASARNHDAVDRVASLLLELRQLDGGENLLPAGFTEIWQAVDEARKLRK